MRYDLEKDLQPIINGDIPLPNFEELDYGLLCGNIAVLGHNLLPEWGYAKIDGHKQWAQYFLTPASMGSVHNGSFDGGGYVMFNAAYPKYSRVGKFSICKHDKKDSPGANHSRGWHPGICVKCGMDMTVDSGD